MDGNAFDRSFLGSEAVRLLDVLLKHVNEIGRAQVPLTLLLKESDLTQGALMRARTELTRANLLRTEPGFSSSGLRGANVYVLNMPVIEPSSVQVPGDESGRIVTDEDEGAGHRDSSRVPAPSRRHRGERKSFWKKFFGRTGTS